MRWCKLKSVLFIVLFQMGIFTTLFAQHYIFIEAEGQQPFYLKRAGQSYSSTAMGFIILPKLISKDLDFIIGFPNKMYPEVVFKINGLQDDRGFYLKQLEGKGWVLVDRQTSSVLLGSKVDVQQAQAIASSASGFAELLADATGDKSLLDKTYLVNTVEKTSASATTPNTKSKTTNTATKQDNGQKQVKGLSKLGTIRSYIQSADSSQLKIAFFDKGVKDNWDTIFVEIDRYLNKPVQLISSKEQAEQKTVIENLPTTNDLTVSTTRLSSTTGIPDCNNPIAMPKDLRELQRRLSKASSLDEQMSLAEKAFGVKCYTTRQVKELGSVFWEEQNRLLFYTRIRKYVSDPSLYGELEQSFMQEGSKKAFREMLKKQSL